MTPERWQQIERVCHDALARDVASRAAFLADVCAGDEALRSEVESLLAQAVATATGKPGQEELSVAFQADTAG
jgi:hypothetical protein